ncbi:CHAT domain-containing protein [Accumulibacter sp.]|uniref:CHAT domain-containing protein n=1 Tax=Accumulibacter sp. TaxID=2053492 RepID=UPI003DA7E9EC
MAGRRRQHRAVHAAVLPQPAGQPGTTKAAALQQAQRALIEGQSGGGTVGGETERQAIRLSAAADQQKAPVDPARPYAHPYYWAPFVLMGNWL